MGPAESMSKSKKNTIDPEIMINQYGADSVRWFILSDSPPEKDVQWSDIGVESANKFLQKIWNLNYLISKKTEKTIDQELEKKINVETNSLINKINESIENFRFNVSIAHFYQAYRVFKDYLALDINSNVLQSNICKIMKLMIPFTPHLAFECLEMFKCKTVNAWPEVDKKNILNEIKVAVQVNGKTRDILTVKKDLIEEEIEKIILKDSKAKKYIETKKITKRIFVKNKIINYIIPN